MGHRSLVAYRRSDGTFALHYAHWGRGLAGRITPATPLGGPAERPAGGRLADRLDLTDGEGYATPATRVDPRPLATGVTPSDVAAAVDASVESLVVVSPACETTTYLVCSLDPTGEGGDLAFARPERDPESVRNWFVRAKSRLAGAVADGTLTTAAARATLRRALAARATVYPTDDASFLRER